MSSREQFWSWYYTGVVEQGTPWLDYSNARVQAQTFALAIEAAGPLRLKTVVDVGCGRGDFCRMLHGLGAARVSGVDIVPELIAEHVHSDPEIRWFCGNILEGDLLSRIGPYDVAFLLEVLQLMPIELTLQLVWERVRPGGRLIAMVPNAKCPIVQRARERFATHYAPPTLEDIEAVVRALPGVDYAAYRGLSFGDDQRVVPYGVGRWQQPWDADREPNRIQFMLLKSAAVD